MSKNVPDYYNTYMNVWIITPLREASLARLNKNYEGALEILCDVVSSLHEKVRVDFDGYTKEVDDLIQKRDKLKGSNDPQTVMRQHRFFNPRARLLLTKFERELRSRIVDVGYFNLERYGFKGIIPTSTMTVEKPKPESTPFPERLPEETL